MVTQPFPWMWTMSGLETGPSTRLLPHNPLHLFFSILISNSNYQSCFFYPNPSSSYYSITFSSAPFFSQQVLKRVWSLLHDFFCLSSGTAAVSLSLCWLIVSQALLRPCLVKAGTLMLRNNDIDKLLPESRLNHSRWCESPVTSWKLPNRSWARIQFSYHQLTFMTTNLSLRTCQLLWEGMKRYHLMVKDSVLQ